ncbi:hypothetical protein [Streptomyces noursei]|uniref:Uncharacterized protein n=1 Tax=Streptomyces noursei TaxID=1971 RepID=A0A2N8PQT6_STRNR|nr:hypothetical protein [Streptomyces noursei]PNE43377.1 hypothetical protein AOB60_00055 [Streptomyces noursei]
MRGFTAKASDDAVKTDLELTCDKCNEWVCDIQDGDSLDVLVAMGMEHMEEKDSIHFANP